MELKGKKIAFLGDSITQGVAVSCKENIYWNLIGQRTGAEVYGYGISGTRIAKQHLPYRFERIDDKYFSTRVETMVPDADMVVIFGGVNDFSHGDAPMGDMNERTEDSFYGACHVLVQKIKARYPAAVIVMMTPLHRSKLPDPLFNDAGVRQVGTLEDYVNAIRQVAAHYGAAVVNLYADCPIDPEIAEQKEKYMPDGVHPNDAGHVLIADALQKVLKEL